MTERLGMHPKFPLARNYLRSFVLGIHDYEKVIERLETYAGGQIRILKSEFLGEHPYGAYDAQQDLTVAANVTYWHSIQCALPAGVEWEVQWRSAVSYQHWACQIDHVLELRALKEFELGKRPQKRRMLFLTEVGFCVGNCISLGWFYFAVDLSRLALEGIEKGVFNDAGDSSGCRRTQLFLLRLVSDWQGWPTSLSQRCAYDEPLFNELLGLWRSPDLPVLEHLLLAACDRHTHQARFDTLRAFYDMTRHDTWYVPFEILSVLRLRESLGLPNPALDHPLMKTPLGRLQPTTPPYTDELLQGVLARVRRELPEFDR